MLWIGSISFLKNYFLLLHWWAILTFRINVYNFVKIMLNSDIAYSCNIPEIWTPKWQKMFFFLSEITWKCFHLSLLFYGEWDFQTHKVNLYHRLPFTTGIILMSFINIFNFLFQFFLSKKSLNNFLIFNFYSQWTAALKIRALETLGDKKKNV